MNPPNKIRVAVNGYGVIGKRVAEAVTRQEDMELAGIADVDTDWRLRVATKKNGFRLYGADGERAEAMQSAGLDVAGMLEDLLQRCDVVVDCTPKRVGAKNAEIYRRNGIKYIVQGGALSAAAGPAARVRCPGRS